jgi:hypothetical protein
MSSDSSPKQHPASENLPPKEEIDFPSLRRRIAGRRQVKQITKIVPQPLAKAAFVALVGGFMLGSVFAAESTAPSAESAPALFNRANALVREGKPGPAILAYERAEQLAPRDPAIAVNLHAVRETAGLATAAPVWWQSAARTLTMNEWAWSGSLALAFVCGWALAGRWLPVRLRQPVKALGAMGAIAVLISVAALGLRWPELSRAVVVNSHVSALIAPAESAGPVFPLAEGEVVTEKKALRNFVLISTADGRSGWVERAQIERVIPAAVPDRAS